MSYFLVTLNFPAFWGSVGPLAPHNLRLEKTSHGCCTHLRVPGPVAESTPQVCQGGGERGKTLRGGEEWAGSDAQSLRDVEEVHKETLQRLKEAREKAQQRYGGQLRGARVATIQCCLTQNYYLRKNISKIIIFSKITNFTRNFQRKSFFPGDSKGPKSLKNSKKI